MIQVSNHYTVFYFYENLLSFCINNEISHKIKKKIFIYLCFVCIYLRLFSCLTVPYVIQPIGLCLGVMDAEITPFKENTLSNETVIGTFPFGEFNLVKHFISFVYRELNMQIVFSPEKQHNKCCAFFTRKNNDTNDWEKCSVSQFIDRKWNLLDRNSIFPLRDIEEEIDVTRYFCIIQGNTGIALQVTKR